MSSTPLSPGAQWLASLWQVRPAKFGIMNALAADGTHRTIPDDRTHDGKYRHVPKTIDDSQLRHHLKPNTRFTYAAPNIGADNQACSIVFDVDNGGLKVVRAALHGITQLGFVAFAQVCPGSAHNGGHIWLLFTAFYDYRRLARLGDQMRRDAGLPDSTERWPNHNNIRLPFGLHQHSNMRGALLLPNGELLMLDYELDAAIAAVIDLPHNAFVPPELPDEPVREAGPGGLSPAPSASAAVSGATSDENKVIDVFNATYKITDLLDQYGYAANRSGKLVRPDGKSASVQVDATRNRSYHHSTSDALRDDDKHAKTPFNVLCELGYGDDPRAAVRAAAKLLGIERDYLATMPPPHFDTVLGTYVKPGVACCPFHKTHLRFSQNNDVWYCASRDVNATTRNGYCSYQWRDEGYAPPERRKR